MQPEKAASGEHINVITHRIIFANQNTIFYNKSLNWHETFAESFTSSRNINDENKIEENKSLAREMENDA